MKHPPFHPSRNGHPNPQGGLCAWVETQLQLLRGDLRSLREPLRVPKATLHPRFDQETRSYVDCPTHRGFPLGGIGNGGLSLFADGGFSEARLNHSWYVPVRDLRGSFFAVRTKDAVGDVRACLLRRTHHHSRELEVPNVAHTRFRGRVPSFCLRFEDDTLPVDLTLRGLSPLIPHDLDASSLPTALFEMEVHNPQDAAVEVSLVFSWQNVLGVTGTGGSALMARHTFRCDYRADGYARAEGDAGITFGIDRDFAANDTRRRAIGEHMIATDAAADVHISRCLAWDERAAKPSFWTEFRDHGTVGEAAASRGGSAALCVKLELAAGESRRVPFQLCWFNPHYVLEKDARKKLWSGRHDGIDHGLYAARKVDSVAALDTQVRAQRPRLWRESLSLTELLDDPERTRLPRDLIDIVLNATDSVWTNSVLTQAGELYTIEALDWRLYRPYANSEWPFGALTGTNDQRLSSHVFTATFFPELDVTELETFRRLTKNGKVPHGNGGAEIALGDTDTPYSEPIAWLNAGHTDWPDLTCSWILQLGKLVKTTGRTDWLERAWPDLCAMAGYLESLVKDGVPEGASTYDIFVYEPCFLYTATLYVAANEMLCDLAELLDERRSPSPSGMAESFRARADAASDAIERKLWQPASGHYRVCAEKDTLFQGGLAGDWISRLAGIRPALPFAQARTHNLAQYRALVASARAHGTFPTQFGGSPLPYNEASADGQPVDLKLFGVLPRKGINYIYQTLSYLALEAIYLGNVAEGIDTIRMVYDKAYGEGYPWDMNLVGLPGFVYMTHPVMWGIFAALSGAAMDVPRRRLELGPKPLPGDTELRIPVFFPRVWFALVYDTQTRKGQLEVLRRFDDAPLVLDELVLRSENDETHRVALEACVLVPGTKIAFVMPQGEQRLSPAV